MWKPANSKPANAQPLRSYSNSGLLKSQDTGFNMLHAHYLDTAITAP